MSSEGSTVWQLPYRRGDVPHESRHASEGGLMNAHVTVDSLAIHWRRPLRSSPGGAKQLRRAHSHRRVFSRPLRVTPYRVAASVIAKRPRPSSNTRISVSRSCVGSVAFVSLRGAGLERDWPSRL